LRRAEWDIEMVKSFVEIEAPSVAAFATAILALPLDTRGDYVATEHGAPWARVSVAPYAGDLGRAVFPLYDNGAQGDSRKRGQCGVSYSHREQSTTGTHHLRVVVERARRMYVA
jgi:hypothetical protein